MIRKIFAVIMFALLLVPFNAYAKSVTVISMGADKAGDEAVAIEKMNRNAAAHCLAFIIPPSPNPDSDFVKIIRAHYKEVTSGAKVAAKKKDGPVVVVTGEVTVDFTKLREIVKREIKGVQNMDENVDEQTAFFVRITGVNNEQLKMRAYQDVLDTYHFVFENLGFNRTDEDVVNIVFGGDANEKFLDYCMRVNSYIENGDAGNIVYAVIGEIALDKLSEGTTGIMWESTARLQARCYKENPTSDGMTGEVIFQFDDDYKLKGRDDNVAFFAMRKAALNSSRALAEHTLDYWKNHR